jgi:transposase
MSRIEVLSGIERRRRWSVEEKRRLVTAAFSPGAVVSEVARRAEVHPNQLYRWRHDLRWVSPGFAEVVVSADFPDRSSTAVLSYGASAMIEVSFADRSVLRLPLSTSSALASAVIGALAGRPVGRSLGEGR